MSELEVFLRIAFLGLGLILLILTIASLIKLKEIKIALAAVGFSIFVVEGIVLVGGIFFNGLEVLATTKFLVGANFIALIFFYLSIIKR
ncbi:MAG: hypothetical protein JSV09_16500 [Thermoplasmata archaeon]|nr:MAG: hypothetical protein JSV09_16500 [Thermoplasmata archaeon]